MKKPKRVQAVEGCFDYLTPGRIYDVVGFWRDTPNKNGYGFIILTDINDKCDCREKDCAHLRGKNWIIIETE